MNSQLDETYLANSKVQERCDYAPPPHGSSLLGQRNQTTCPKSHALLHTAFERSPFGMLVVDSDGTIVAVNHGLDRLLGYARAKLISQSVRNSKVAT